MSRGSHSFGRYVRALRKGRGYTQEMISTRSGLSADTIRRLERSSFSPSLNTLEKLCAGLGLSMSTLFLGYELGVHTQMRRELVDLILTKPKAVQKLAFVVLEQLFETLDAVEHEPRVEHDTEIN